MGLYQDLEDEVIADIARRVQKTGRYTETAELMAKSMVEQGYSAERIQAEVMKLLRADTAYRNAVAENTKAYKQEIQDIINRTVKEAKEAGNELVAEAGNMAWNNDLSMWQEHGVDLKQPNSMSQLLTSFQAQTAGELKNLTRTMGFKNTVFGTTGVLNAYQREMDLALLKVATGAFSYDQAVNDCVHRLAKSGLRSIDYESGRTYQLDTAARMCVRTGLSQLSGKIMEANLAQTGQDLVITSQHMGSRPEHAPWQNRVFSYSGKSKKYPDFFKSTGYGTATGLKGVNCTHDFYPFWEGVDFIQDDLEEPAPVTINGKEYTYYQTTQQQRKMERDIRATKREIEAQRAIGGSTAELEGKLRKQTADYKKFSAEAGLRVKQNRLRVQSGTSNLNANKKSTKPVKQKADKKTSSYNKKSVESSDKSDKINLSEKQTSRVQEKEKTGTLREVQEDMFRETGVLIKGAEDIDISTVQRVADRYAELVTNNPHMKGFIQDIEFSDELNVGTYAARKLSIDESGRVSRKILLNKSQYSDIDMLEKQYMAGVKSGHFPKGTTVDNIIDHEFGHALADDISLRMKGINLDEKLFSVEEWDRIRIGGQVLSKIFVEDAAKRGKVTVKKLQGQISKYAKADYSEAFAEAFLVRQVRIHARRQR